MKLWVDDERIPPPGWCWVKTVHEARLLIKTREIEVISLDNDLGDYTVKSGLEGRHVLDTLLERGFDGIPLPHVIIHTQNPIARASMVNAISSARRYGVSVEFDVCPAEVL